MSISLESWGECNITPNSRRHLTTGHPLRAGSPAVIKTDVNPLPADHSGYEKPCHKCWLQVNSSCSIENACAMKCKYSRQESTVSVTWHRNQSHIWTCMFSRQKRNHAESGVLPSFGVVTETEIRSTSMWYSWQPARIGNELNFDCFCLDIRLGIHENNSCIM